MDYMDRNRRYNDEWGQIVQQQAHTIALKEQEEKEQLHQSKLAYRNELNYLQQFKAKEKEQDDYLRNLELDAVKQKQTLLQQDRIREKEEKIKQQLEMQNFYKQHEDYKKQIKKEERQQQIADEQKNIAFLTQRMKQEVQQEKQQKESNSQDVKDMLSFIHQQEIQRKETENKEKQDDLHRARDLHRNYEEKQAEYREYYRRIDDQQRQRQQDLQTKTIPVMQAKDNDLNLWISRHEQSHKRSIELKEARDLEIAAQNLQNTKNSIQIQLQEKKRQNQLKKLEQEQNAKQARDLMYRNLQYENEERDEKIRQQMAYREMLKAQFQMDEDKRAEEFKLTDKERAYHRISKEQIGQSQMKSLSPPPIATQGLVARMSNFGDSQRTTHGSMNTLPNYTQSQTSSPTATSGLAGNFYTVDKSDSYDEVHKTTQPTSPTGKQNVQRSRFNEARWSEPTLPQWNPALVTNSQTVPTRNPALQQPTGRYGSNPIIQTNNPLIHYEQSNPLGVPQPSKFTQDRARSIVRWDDLPAGALISPKRAVGHNPITNPVGSDVPYPGDQPLYKARHAFKTLSFSKFG